MAICAVVYAIGQIFLVAGKLTVHIERSWGFALSPTIVGVFAGVIAFVVCMYMTDETPKFEEDESESE